MVFGDLYSKYYDLLYEDKDYISEVTYIGNIINKHAKGSKSILELGCGTGKHAELLCEKGYKVFGVDKSPEMLIIAENRRKGLYDKLNFQCSDIKFFETQERFDVVISLLHVFSYLNTNEDLIMAFKTAKKHLISGGILIFDFWYGPAVLTDPPVIRVKKLENKEIKITRVAEPFINTQKNIADINYTLFMQDKSTKQIHETTELHSMRYFFDTDLELLCKMSGFEVVKKYRWMSLEEPSLNSWNVVWIVKS